jgi:hypothetical protein
MFRQTYSDIKFDFYIKMGQGFFDALELYSKEIAFAAACLIGTGLAVYNWQ